MLGPEEEGLMDTLVGDPNPPPHLNHSLTLPGGCEVAESRVMSGVRKQGVRAIVLERGFLAQDTWVCQPS